jgi:hypothetical protein
MEKMMYPVWRSDHLSAAEFRDQLTGEMSEKLLSSGVRKLTVSVDDEDVLPAANLRQKNTNPAIDGVISMWVDSANFRKSQEDIIAQYVARYNGYLVTESEPIVNVQHPVAEGKRTYGMNQVVFLKKPSRISYDDWIEVWHNSHGQIAIDTQSTFGYRQNVIVRPLTYAAPSYHAIVEESFPPEAMTSPQAFYDAVGDEQKYQANQKAMIESVVRFIDFDKIDVIPMSEYAVKL